MNRDIRWIFEAYLPESVSDEALKSAAADAFGVGSDRVCVETDVEPTGRPCDVLVTRLTIAAPDDPAFPHTIRVFARVESSDKAALARGMSAALGMAVVADAADPDLQDDWMLVFPDGTSRLVTIDDDDSFRLSPRDLAEIARARMPAHRAA